jgi:SAM-dependent methyltransferase
LNGLERPSYVICLAAAAAAVGLSLPVARAAQAPAGLFLRTSDAFNLARLGASTAETKDSLPGFRRFPFGGMQLPEASILAFEENRLFTMVVADLTRKRSDSEPRLKDDSPRVIRRVLLLKPSTLVFDDEVRKTASGKRLAWSLQTNGTPEVNGRQIRIVEGEQELVIQPILPRNVQVAKTPRRSGVPQAGFVVDLSPAGDAGEVRFLNVLYVRQSGEKEPVPSAEVTQRQGPTRPTVRSGDRTFQLVLPSWRDGAGEIAVLDATGKTLVERRPLASGVLPHTAEGIRMLERWDAAYRGGQPAWNTGRPSSELVQAVEKGTVRPCRAVELGCGTGTNAVYLAGRDFEMTGIDLAPTALTLAEKKAREAGVSVRWLLADVLAPPKLDPFDFIYDRGCYHGVRRANAAGYVDSLRRLSKPGTRVLILAGNANEPEPRSGPPRVTEEEIRADFSKHFEIVELRETHFDAADPQAKGALAWCILLRRKE